MSKYQRTFNDDKDVPTSTNFLDQNNILFSKQSFDDKRRKSSLKSKLNSNLVDKLAMDSGLSKKSTLIGLNSITNPINSELNEPLTEIELDNDDNMNSTIHHLDLLSANNENQRMSAHDLLTNLNNQTQKNQSNQSEPSNMKRMFVSLDTNLENGSNLNRSYLYSTNTLIESDMNQDQTNPLNNEQSRTLGMMNPVHLNNCSNNFQSSPNVSFFGLQSTDVTGNTLFGNIGKLKNNARFSTFFRQIKFIWRRATLLERLFGLIMFLLLFIICYLSFTVLSLKQYNRNLEQIAHKQPLYHFNIAKYCLTPQCINVASAMLSAMNNQVEPCDDFYNYACGGWINQNPLPVGKSIWGAFGKLWQENQLAMKNVLEENITYTSDAQRKAKIYYQSCLDKNETIEKLSSKPMLDFIEVINGWNITGKVYNVQNWSLADSLEVLHCKYNRGGLFSWAVGSDERNSSRHILQLDQAPLGLPSPAYYALNGSDDSILKAYERYMIKVAQLLKKSENFFNKTNGTQNLEDSLFSYRTDDEDSDLVKYQSTLNLIENLGEQHGIIGDVKGYEKNLLKEYEEDKEIERQMKLVLQFEIELANITVPLEDRRDDEHIYHKLNISDLNKLCPVIDWKRYFTYAFDQINYTISDNEPVIVYSPEYIREMSKLIERYLSTNDGKVILSNYLVWTAVQSLTSYLSKPFRDASKILRKALIGSEGKESAWRYCVTDTNSVMGFALGAMFVDSVFKGEAKPIAQQMIEQIREAFKENLQSLDWMDANTRKLATEKADAITDMIGFPDFILDANKLDEKYDGLNFTENEYFENNIKVNIFSLRKNIEKIVKPGFEFKTEWQMSPSTVNAYYTPTKNQIVFPAGILQTPFYDIHYPKSLNYGAMGVVMGHELTHAFDDQGRGYDKFGNLHQWWKNSTINNFKDRMQCFVKQYAKYQANGDHVNGKQTLGENIADNGGLKASYRAYEKWMADNELELALPGVNLTNHQLFFIGFAQVWCSVSTVESLKLQLLNDPHSPAEFRVIGTLSNSKEFAKHFNCPTGSPMNPAEKCTIW